MRHIESCVFYFTKRPWQCLQRAKPWNFDIVQSSFAKIRWLRWLDFELSLHDRDTLPSVSLYQSKAIMAEMLKSQVETGFELRHYRRGFLIQPIGKYQLLLAWCKYPPSFHCKTLALLCQAKLCRITVGISNMVDFKWNSLKAVSHVADVPLVLMWSKVRRSWWGCGCCQTKVKNTTQVS